MKPLLLDTAVWCNLVTSPNSVARAIREHGQFALCSISLLEAAILHRLGRLDWAGEFGEFLSVALGENVVLYELTPAVAIAERGLPASFHGDPFDRTITATAKTFDLTLATTDPRIHQAGECAVKFYRFRERV